MKKWYKQPYFDRKVWIIENFEKLNLSAEECMLILLINHGKENKKKLSYDYFCKKLSIDTKKLDKILANLVNKHYLKINSNEKGLTFDIEAIFEFDPEAYEVVVNKDVYELTEDLLNKPLTPSQLQKVNDLVEKYGDNLFKDALRKAEAYRKPSLEYVEGILRNEKK